MNIKHTQNICMRRMRKGGKERGKGKGGDGGEVADQLTPI